MNYFFKISNKISKAYFELEDPILELRLVSLAFPKEDSRSNRESLPGTTSLGRVVSFKYYNYNV